MFVHQVYFWLKNPERKEDQAQLLKGIQSLSAIEPKISFHVGVPAETDRPVIDRSYSFSELIIFDDLAGHDNYQVHPLHSQFVEENKHLWEKVVIYDAVDA